MPENEYKHPYEVSGMGQAPYKNVGMYALPSPALAEANPEAYNNALREMPKTAGSIGSCSFCGMSITYNFLVKSSDGRIWPVGSECVAKVGLDSEAALRNAQWHARRRMSELIDAPQREKRIAEAGEKWRIEQEQKKAAEDKLRNDRIEYARKELPSVVKFLWQAKGESEFFGSLWRQWIHDGSKFSWRQGEILAKEAYKYEYNDSGRSKAAKQAIDELANSIEDFQWPEEF